MTPNVAAAQTTGTIVGTVVDENNKPVPDLTVAVGQHQIVDHRADTGGEVEHAAGVVAADSQSRGSLDSCYNRIRRRTGRVARNARLREPGAGATRRRSSE